MKKHSFLLLEILIALTILASFASFIFYSPLSFLKKEKAQLESMAKERLYLQTIEEIKLLLFKNELNLVFNTSHKTSYSLEQSNLCLTGFKPVPVERNFQLWFNPKKASLGRLGQTLNLLHAKIFLKTPLDPFNTKDNHNDNSKTALFFIQKLTIKESQKP